MRIVYLDEISRGDDLPISLGIVKLVVTPQEQVKGVLPDLLEKLQQKIIDQELERQVFEFIETILLYKFTNLSREEIEAMFSLSDLKESKVYQEAKAEGKAEGELLGKLKAVKGLLSLGLSVGQVALALEVEVVMVEQVAAGIAAEDIVQEFLGQGTEIDYN